MKMLSKIFLVMLCQVDRYIVADACIDVVANDVFDLVTNGVVDVGEV